MWRFLAGVASALLLAGAGVFLFRSSARTEPPIAALTATAASAATDGSVLADDGEIPAATAKTREERRFGRYDKDKDGAVARDEFLASRRKAFVKLDVDGDGRLSFDEWAVKAMAKFAAADADRSGRLTPAEFATTAVKRKARPRPNCPPPAAREAAPAPAEDQGEDT